MSTPAHPKLGFLLHASAVATLGGLLFGYDTAVIAGTVEFLQRHFQLSDIELGWTVSSALIGCMPGAALAASMGDRLGRKGALVVAAVLFFVSAVWAALARGAGELALARIVGGVGIGAASMLTPVYISEIAPARLRGALTTLNQIALLIGMVAVYMVNAWLASLGDDAWKNAYAWRWMFGSGALPAAVFFLLLFGIPESPRWLMLKGRIDEARGLLKKLNGGADVSKEMEDLQRSLQHKPGGFRDCFLPQFRRVFVIGATLAVLQQITGINIVMYYAPRIFTSAGLDTSSAIGHSVIIGLVMLVFTIPAMFLADRAGRRPLLLISAAGMAVGLFALAASYSGKAAAAGNVSGWLLLLWVLLYVAAFSVGIGPLVWTILGEIFPNRIRAHAAGICVLLLWLANFLVSQFFPYLLSQFGAKVFWGYGIICVFTVLFIAKYVQETKNRSLEDLESDLAR